MRSVMITVCLLLVAGSASAQSRTERIEQEKRRCQDAYFRDRIDFDGLVTCSVAAENRHKPFIDFGDPVIWTVPAGRIVDLLTTNYALSHGAYEAVLTQNMAANVAMESGLAVAEMWLLSRLNPGKTRDVVGYALYGTTIAVGAHNIKVTRSMMLR